ncbi:MAG TPA: FGGY-family carbohydrate kinase [Anaerolineales bacterium]
MQNLPERFSILLAREKVFDRQGSRQDQARDLDTLDILAEQLQEPGLQAAVLLRRASLAFVTADYARAVETAQQALPLSQAAGDVKGETEILVMLGKALIWQGDSRAASIPLERARELAHASNLSGREADSLFNLSIAASNSSEFGQASDMLEQSLEIYRASGDQAGEGAALGQAGVIYAGQGDFARARQYFEAALKISRTLGYRMREGILLRDKIIYNQDELLQEANVPDIFKVIDQIAARVPAGANGVLYTPWIWGERAPVDDKYLRAGLFNLSLHNNREDVIRAFLEGIAFNTRWVLEPVEKFLRRKVHSIHIVGGGAQSDIWCQIFADVLNVEIKQVREPVYANARGAAWIGAVGLGEFTFQDVSRMVPIKRIYQPDQQNSDIYQERFQVFTQVYRQMKDVYYRLNR